MPHVFAASSTHASTGGASRAPDDRFVAVPLSIAARSKCTMWPYVLRTAGWRAFPKKRSGAGVTTIDWLIKSAEHVFMLTQLEGVDCPQEVHLPAEKQQQLLVLFENARLVAH